MSNSDVELTIYSDYICPFCYLGRRSLELYEADRGEAVSIDWHPFDLRSHRRGPDGELDHDLEDGKDDAYYEQARENVRQLQERYGVEMTRDLATEIDSLPAQIVSYHIQEADPDQWRDFDEAVFEAVWVNDRDIEDPDVLAALADEVGLDPAVVETALQADAPHERVFKRFDEAHRHGVTGVPTFAYDGRAARGAVPPEQLRRLVEGASGGD